MEESNDGYSMTHLPYEKNNERLEFLGDAVLELVSSDFIFHEQATNALRKWHMRSKIRLSAMLISQPEQVARNLLFLYRI